MTEKTEIKLGSVQTTLLLPLWGRAIESQMPNARLTDKTAVEIIKNINYDFSVITKNINQTSKHAWIARTIHFDNAIREFIRKFPHAVIINIGCGLDTTFERVDNGSILWYDLDLPDTIELRRKFIKESSRRIFISASCLEEEWVKFIPSDKNILFISAGVMYYFEEEQVKGLLKRIADNFPGSEFIFDAASPGGVKIANKKVIESSGLDESSYLKWGIIDAGVLESWNENIKLIESYPLFKNMKKGMSIRQKFLTYLSDKLKIMFIVHLSFRH